jgi:hypothetical protein
MSRMLRLVLPPLVACALTTLAAAGCTKHADKPSATQNAAFDGAASDIKQTWDQALSADQSGNFVDAWKLLNKVMQSQLTNDQRDTLNAEFDSFGPRLAAAAKTNNPSAVQAVQLMRTR